MNSETRKTVYDALTAAHAIQKARARERIYELDNTTGRQERAWLLAEAEAHELAAADILAQRVKYAPAPEEKRCPDCFEPLRGDYCDVCKGYPLGMPVCPNGSKACDCH